MEEKNKTYNQFTENLSQQEKDFCELYVNGAEPFGGNARKCYADVFGVPDDEALTKAKILMKSPIISDYIEYLREFDSFDASAIKTHLTEKLLGILDETSTATYQDRFGTQLSPAPLRSVAVSAARAIMEIYPVRSAQKSEVELKAGNGSSGITFNVIVPNQAKSSESLTPEAEN